MRTQGVTKDKTVEHLNLPKEERCFSWMGAKKKILNELEDRAKTIPYQIKSISVYDAYQAFFVNMHLLLISNS